jgi:hypothetical protein
MEFSKRRHSTYNDATQPRTIAPSLLRYLYHHVELWTNILVDSLSIRSTTSCFFCGTLNADLAVDTQTYTFAFSVKREGGTVEPCE